MPGALTPILGLTPPTIGGDNNTWGSELNGDLTILDSLGAVQVVSTAIDYVAAVGVSPETVILVTTGTGDINITLPIAASAAGRIFTVKKVDAAVGTITITPNTGTIDGSATWTINTQFSFVRMLCDGANYDVIGVL